MLSVRSRELRIVPASERPPWGAARKKERRWVRWSLVVPLILAGGVSLCLAGGVLLAETGREERPTRAERELALDIGALSRWLPGYVPVPGSETFRKVRYLDGSYDLQYEYDPGREEAPFLRYDLSFERDRIAATAVYLSSWAATEVGLTPFGRTDLEVEERNGTFRWGDRSRFATLRRSGIPVGNLFLAQHDRLVLSFFVVGVHFEDPTAFAEMISPFLSRTGPFLRERGSERKAEAAARQD